MIQLLQERKPDTGMLREVYCNTLIEMAKTDDRIVALDSDLMSSSGMKPFKNTYPDRFFNVGVAEANLIGVAAGLASVGKIPFAHSFGTFATRRCCDQIFMSAAYAKLPVKIVGTDPGVTAAYNGGTHMPLEDMAVLRGIPGLILVEPVDRVQLEQLLPQIAQTKEPVYFRLQRKVPIAIFETGSQFNLFEAPTLREGTDVTLIASGIMVAKALEAAEILAKVGVSARVINTISWKPIDEKAIEKAAAQTGAIVTCENHNVVGGLGSAVAETLVKHHPVPVEMIGTQDHFGEVGDEAYLVGKFHMSPADIAAAAQRAIARK